MVSHDFNYARVALSTGSTAQITTGVAGAAFVPAGVANANRAQQLYVSRGQKIISLRIVGLLFVSKIVVVIISAALHTGEPFQ